MNSKGFILLGVAAICVAASFVPDPIPFVDEILLSLGTIISIVNAVKAFLDKAPDQNFLESDNKR